MNHDAVWSHCWIAGAAFILSQLFVVAAILGFRSIFGDHTRASRSLVIAAIGLFVGAQGFFVGSGALHLEIAVDLYTHPAQYTLHDQMGSFHMMALAWIQAAGGSLAAIGTVWIISSTVRVARGSRANDG